MPGNLSCKTTMTTLPTFPLSMAGAGDRLRIVALADRGNFRKRMTEIGLNIGAELTVRQSHGGGMLLVCGETRLALGSGMAHKIIVAPMDINLNQMENSK